MICGQITGINKLKIKMMNKSITDILDYVLVEYEHLTTVQQCNYILNKYDIEITNDILMYMKNNG